MKTKAAVLIARETLVLMDLEIPKLESGQVLVKMEYSGICGTQVGEFLGNRGSDNYLPHCLGHEGVGTVVDKYSDVGKVDVGDTVVVSWITGRGKAAQPPKYGEVNAGYCNTLMTYSIVSENRVYKLDSTYATGEPYILPEHALLGCAIPTGAGTVDNILRPEPGSSVAVWGCGGVGLCSIVALQDYNVRIVAIDTNDRNLDRARSIGSIATSSIGDTDYSIVAVGSSDVISEAVSHTEKRCVVIGHPSPEDAFFKVEAHRLIRGLELRGSWGGNCDMDTAVSEYGKNVRRYRGICSIAYNLKYIDNAMQGAITHVAPRIIVRLNQEGI